MHVQQAHNQTYFCDCCGTLMYTHACKITCPNCGFRFDWSDLTLNFDPKLNTTPPNINDFYGKQISTGK